MANDKKERKELELLYDALVDDILAASDEEIMAEAAEDYEDVDEIVLRSKALVRDAITKTRKRKLQLARSAVDARRGASSAKVRGMSIDEKREVLRRYIAHAPDGLKVVKTLAARKEDELEDQDLEATLEALLRLGAIDDEGNPN